MKLLFKATRDGQHCSKFHNKCDNRIQQLVFIKTTKGEILVDIQKKPLEAEIII